MNFDKYTLKMQSAINAAVTLAEDKSSTEITTFHVLLPLLEDKEGILAPLFDKIGAPRTEIQEEVNNYIERLPKIYGDVNRGLSRALQKVFQRAEKVSVEFKDEYVSTEHFLLASLREDADVKDLLGRYGVDEKSVLEALKSIRGDKKITSNDPESGYQALEKYCRDMTRLAMDDKLDPVIGRDEEIRRVMQVLSRRTKNNPVLIGEPGVGKTAIVPSIFNINEPMIFGAPIVLNPMLIIPFIIVPLLNGIISYLFTSWGWVNHVVATAPWTLPGPIGAFLATGNDWRAAVLNIALIILSVVIYFPFFKMYDSQLLAEENETETEE